MVSIKYDSWQREYKFPFGACKKDEQVHFSITVYGENIHSVELLMRKEDGSKGIEYLMMDSQDAVRYSCDYFFSEGVGIYFYYFRIIQWEGDGPHTYFYGCDNGKGGAGKIDRCEAQIYPYQITCYEKKDRAPKWYREAVAYQIFPDRFFNGASKGEIIHPKKNTFIYATPLDDPMYIKDETGAVSRWDFFGGNLAGIIEKLPYLEELGVTVVYLNPIFEAASNHRYDTSDYLKIDPMLGEEADLVALLSALHARGMHLILDGVFSHVGMNSRYFNKKNDYSDETGAFQSKESPYYPWFEFTDYPIKYKSWWDVLDLPEINKENPDFQQFIYGKNEHSVLSKWNKLGVDGWRLDVADELPDEFIQGIRENLDQFDERVLIGEVWEDASNKIAYEKRRKYVYGRELHGMMNYPFRTQILDFVRGTVSPKEIAVALMTLQENYPPAVFYNNLNNIGTHDTKRIFTELAGETALLKQVVGLLFSLPGVPCIYYGDEAGLSGQADPDNRRFYPWGHENEKIMNIYKEWALFRKKHPELIHGDLQLFYTPSLLGVVRFINDQYVVSLLNATDKLQLLQREEIFFLKNGVLEETVLYEHLGEVSLAPHTIYTGSFSLEIN